MPEILRKAHEKNDKAVLKVFGLALSASEDTILSRLFEEYAKLESIGKLPD
jgi:hypothetical protein